MMYEPRRMAVAITSMLLAMGCAGSESGNADSSAAPAAAAAPNMVTFTASEYAFDGPDTIPAGLTMFHLSGGGQQLHHLQLIKLQDGKTFDDLMTAMKGGGEPPAWAMPYGGVNPPVPGGMSIATEVVEPGNYAVICLVPGPDHLPHVAHGMAKPLTVTGTLPASITEPTPDVTMTLSDYTFTLSKELTAGRHTIKVENSASQPHEAVFVQLDSGKTMQDLGQWVDNMTGPPPGRPLGGIPAFMPGKTAYFDVSLSPGDYGVICFVPDAKDGKPHFMHGMVQQFKIS